MIRLPVKLHRIEKPDEDQALVFEIESAHGGTMTNKDLTLDEMLYNTTVDETMSVNQFLGNE
jgi:hypothetical protein